MKMLLDYVFPIEIIEEIPAVDVGFLKRVAVVVKPKLGVLDTFVKVTSPLQIETYTDNSEVSQLFSAGMNEVFLILSDDLNIDSILEENKGEFYTLLISTDFTKEEIGGVFASEDSQVVLTANVIGEAGNNIDFIYINNAGTAVPEISVTDLSITIGIMDGVTTSLQVQDAINSDPVASLLVTASGGDATPINESISLSLSGGVDPVNLSNFEGVTGVSDSDVSYLESQAKIKDRVAFFGNPLNGAKNMFFAFGKMLSSFAWENQQYIEMPFNDAVDNISDANSMFEKRISFVINDEEFGNRLAMFAVGGIAIVAPYVTKNLRVEMQFTALKWINANKPSYTLKEASLLESRIQEDVINSFIERGLIESGEISISLIEKNFVANGEIEVPNPKALWRVFNRMVQTN